MPAPSLSRTSIPFLDETESYHRDSLQVELHRRSLPSRQSHVYHVCLSSSTDHDLNSPVRSLVVSPIPSPPRNLEVELRRSERLPVPRTFRDYTPAEYLDQELLEEEEVEDVVSEAEFPPLPPSAFPQGYTAVPLMPRYWPEEMEVLELMSKRKPAVSTMLRLDLQEHLCWVRNHSIYQLRLDSCADGHHTLRSPPSQAWVDHVDNMPAIAKVEAFRNMLTAIAESNELGNKVVFKLLQWGSDRPSIL